MWRLCVGAALVALCLTAPAAAQERPKDGWSLSGTTRLRYETIDGQARAGFDADDDLINLRTTLLAEYRDGPFRVATELWDSRVYGDDPGTPVTTGEVNAVELVQAFVEGKADGVFGPGSTASLQVGRFMLALGSRRLIAADDYRNTTSGSTGARADLGLPRGWHATLIYTLPQQRRPDDRASLGRNAVAFDHEGFDLVLWGGLVSKTKAIGDTTIEVSFFHLRERDEPGRPTRDRSLNTLSLRLIRDPASRRLDYEVEGIVQRGQISASLAPTAARQDVSAWFLHADAGYTFAGGWKPRLSIEYDHASGDASGGKYGRFDTLFGMRRADLAPAGLYNAIARSNIISPGVRVEVVPNSRTDAFASLRPIWLAARQDSFSSTGVRDPSGNAGSFAGTQLDARIRHRLTKAMTLEVDAVLLAKGRFLRDAPNAPPGRWTRYLSLNATASF